MGAGGGGRVGMCWSEGMGREAWKKWTKYRSGWRRVNERFMLDIRKVFMTMRLLTLTEQQPMYLRG